MTSPKDNADLIRNAVLSTSKCTSATAALLNDILLINSVTQTPKAVPSDIATQKSKTTARARPGSAPKTTSKGRPLPSREDAKKPITGLSPKEKAILATEVINSTLKALGNSARPSAPLRRQPSNKDVLETVVRNSLRRSNSVPPSPLQPRSLVRVSSSPNIASRSRPSSASSSLSNGNRAAAECSRIAFACLRALQASKLACTDLPQLQLEQGMSALIGKLITLGLDDLAVKELRILKRRLAAIIKPQDASATRKINNTAEHSKTVPSTTQSLSELLLFDEPPVGEGLLNLVITTQLQILKLIAASKKPLIITAALSILQSDFHTSPTQLLLYFAKESPTQSAKAARQLETLSQLILSLSPNISSAEDSTALSPNSSVSPEVALELQTLALINRILSWKLTGHQGDMDKDILQPFSRCLAAFTRRSHGNISGPYNHAKKTFKALEKEGSDFTATSRGKGRSPLATIYSLLASLSRDAECFEDSILWIEMLLRIMERTKLSEVANCTISAKLAGVKLRISSQVSGVNELLKTVLTGLQAPLKGDSLELDELLTEVSLLRRIAITLLSKRATSPVSGEGQNLTPEIRQLCESLILTCPRFSLRYLGRALNDNSTAKAMVQYEQRRQLLAKSCFQTIDSALYLLKVSKNESRLTWDLMDSTLQDCLAILEIYDPGLAVPSSNSSLASASYYVRVSHIYYGQHLDMRRDAETPKDVQYLKPLRRSIDCIHSRSTSEKKAAVLTSKLERMAEMLKSVGRYDMAKEMLLMLRDELIGDDILSLIGTIACSASIQRAWDHSDDTCMLARTVTSLTKLDLRSNSVSLEDLSSYDSKWSIEVRGIMLEHILSVMSKHIGDVAGIQAEVCRELLEIYDPAMFPIRRLRTITSLLGYGFEKRRDLIEAARKAISFCSIGTIIAESQDAELKSHLPHLLAYTSSTLELLEDHPRLDLIKPHIASWASMVGKCEDYESLSSKVDDVKELLHHLHSIADFLAMKGCGRTRLAVLEVLANLNRIPRSDSPPDDLILDYCSLAIQYLDLGYSGKAGLALDKAQTYASRNGVNLNARLRHLLSHAEYLLKIGNADKCEEFLLRARTLALQEWNEDDQRKIRSGRLAKVFISNLLADASLLHSLLALERGALKPALSHAKLGVRHISRAWLRMETKQISQLKNSSQSVEETLPEDTANLSLSVTVATSSTKSEYVPGLSAWKLVKPMFECLSHLSKVYAHHGMFQETIYYAEQAYKIVDTANSPNYMAKALAITGNIWLKSGVFDKASQQLTHAKELCILSSEDQNLVVLHSHLASLHRHESNEIAESAAYKEAEALLEALIEKNYISNLGHIIDPAAILEAQMSRLALAPAKKASSSRSVSRKKVLTTKGEVATKSSGEVVSTVSNECPQLLSLKGSLLRQRAGSLMLSKCSEEAAVLLKESEKYSSFQTDAIDQHIKMAKHLFLKSMEQMTADPIYSVLQDSTISFPSVIGALKTAVSAAEKGSGLATSPRNAKGASSRGVARNQSPSRRSFFDMLRQAHDHLIEAHSLATQYSSTALIHSITSLLNASVITLSAAGSLKIKAAHPGSTTSFIEMARTLSMRRERDALFGDTSTQLQKEEELSWPNISTADLRKSGNGSSLELVRFQKEFIDVIPQNWTVVSIALGEGENELCLTKLQAGQSPFVLRVPLGRNNSRDADEQVFDFAQGKSELLKIIELANASAHGARDISGRGAKTAWWAERDALDARLKELLDNIETVWLGGFRGIFSQHTRHTDLLARFQRTFQNILDKHLPSRQKTGKKVKAPRIVLDTRILELFVGLGDPSSTDLDETLTDLLYFVIDILQFNGERNAYDEIDFDSIVVETADALRYYHEAVLAASVMNEDKHTILILDKALHAFPWESLPCMDRLAVSRLPSLGCLRDRLLLQQNNLATNGREGHFIDRKKGAYILNPGGDLKSTQTEFETRLQGLKTWNSIVERVPSELEMKENLENRDLLLYFGHGSGAQFIRSKTIKKLEKCAVAVLMGCSSGALTEAGEFEPYGPPISYMLGGSPAVVATLWDVTDKDIDRFATSTFEHWGLTQVQEKPSKGKGKKKEEVSPVQGGEHLSLVEAVAKGRKACNYRYLTAAAVCVYGIPVYFK